MLQSFSWFCYFWTCLLSTHKLTYLFQKVTTKVAWFTFKPSVKYTYGWDWELSAEALIEIEIWISFRKNKQKARIEIRKFWWSGNWNFDVVLSQDFKSLEKWNQRNRSKPWATWSILEEFSETLIRKTEVLANTSIFIRKIGPILKFDATPDPKSPAFPWNNRGTNNSTLNPDEKYFGYRKLYNQETEWNRWNWWNRIFWPALTKQR